MGRFPAEYIAFSPWWQILASKLIFPEFIELLEDMDIDRRRIISKNNLILQPPFFSLSSTCLLISSPEVKRFEYYGTIWDCEGMPCSSSIFESRVSTSRFIPLVS